MKRNLLAYGILGGIAGYADGKAEEAQAERRMAEQRALLADRAAEREEQIRLQAELRGARGGTGSRGAGGADGAPFDPLEAEKRYRFAAGVSEEEEANIRDGSAFGVKRIKALNDDGTSRVLEETGPDGWEALRKARVEELDALRRGVAFGKDTKTVAEGRSIDFDTNRAGEVAAKDGPYTGVLANNAKPLYSATESGATNVATGGQSLNPLGKAKANDENASAAQHMAKVKELQDELAVPGEKSKERLSSLLNSINKTIEDTQGRKEFAETYAAASRLRNQVLGQIESLGGQPAAKPGAPKPSPAKSPYKEGQKLKGPDGKTYIVKGGVPVPMP